MVHEIILLGDAVHSGHIRRKFGGPGRALDTGKTAKWMDYRNKTRRADFHSGYVHRYDRCIKYRPLPRNSRHLIVEQSYFEEDNHAIHFRKRPEQIFVPCRPAKSEATADTERLYLLRCRTGSESIDVPLHGCLRPRSISTAQHSPKSTGVPEVSNLRWEHFSYSQNAICESPAKCKTCRIYKYNPSACVQLTWKLYSQDDFASRLVTTHTSSRHFERCRGQPIFEKQHLARYMTLSMILDARQTFVALDSSSGIRRSHSERLCSNYVLECLSSGCQSHVVSEDIDQTSMLAEHVSESNVGEDDEYHSCLGWPSDASVE
ncbi:hypothetical protein DOTSEDRAFT_38824 [Dothistroma septosporum NZE10]|uniref:Uncharacterized protein n=1 Tax=Dothistroma septosporum (strain NZE10 / CBS 128990) TaxID=675120 RepID=M2WL24_DOTSN|nr:hypothetical protein DOTSEDRAFT_38824 [Dothistroma septosporum NZE10]